MKGDSFMTAKKATTTKKTTATAKKAASVKAAAKKPAASTAKKAASGTKKPASKASTTQVDKLKAENAALKARVKDLEKILKDTVKNINKAF